MLEKITKLGDIGPKERHMRGDLITETVNGVRVAICRSPVLYHPMFRRKQINLEQFCAADKLRCDWEQGIIGYKSCEVREKTSGGGPKEITNKQIDHNRAYYKALDSLSTTEKPLVLQVVINDQTLTAQSDAGQKRTRNRKKLKEFKQALFSLAKHYGFC